eukprot:GFUD01038610.1.p1 GENE.GFUD01038610.1~~GFUD01038610.1.p1  ORF type:complete len:501 (+),score=173.14 GFUD01038610.1:2-1504(+)
MDDQHGIDILFAEEEDSDDETTSADESNDDIDDVIESRKRKKKMLYLEKLNIFMEANAPFPMKTSMNLKESSSHPDKNVTIGNISSSIQNENVCDESESAKLQSEFSKNSSTQTIFEAVFEKSLENASCSQRRHEVEYSFSSVRPQNKRFRYGSDSDKISMTEKDKDKAKTNQRNEDPSVELKHEEKESKTPLSENTHDKAFCSSNLRNATQSFAPIRKQENKFRYGSDLCKSNEQMQGGQLKTSSSPVQGLQDSRLKESTDDSESSEEYLITTSSDQNSDDQYKNEKRPQENRFRYGSDLCKSNEQMQRELKINQTRGEKSKDDKKDEGSEKEGLTRKTGHLKKSSSPVPGLQDSRLKKSTDDSESSEEYLITTSSDQNSDDQYKNEKRPQENRFRYGSDLCKSNEQMQRELKINQTRGEKSKDDKKDEGSEKEGLTRKTGHLKKSSSPVPGLQDSRLKKSTDDSESSEEYLITTSSDQNSDDQYKNEKRPQMKRGYFA